jgi:AcrR family transcriptional regulator
MVTDTQPDLGRRERRRVQTEDRIVKAAIQLFNKQGFAQTTVEQITEAADVGKGTFFNYFPNKEAVLGIIFRIQGEALAEMADKVQEATDVREFLLGFIHAFLTKHQRTPVLVRSIFGVTLSYDHLRMNLLEMAGRARAGLTVVLERGQRLGQVRTDVSAADLAATFQRMVIGTHVFWALHESQDLHKLVDTSFEVIWSGIAARATAGKGPHGKTK